mgnify:CR=1 FL=1
MNLLKIFYILICCLTYTILPAQQKPNIIYIYADDLGYNELGCYGQQKIKTPNIDRMATEGMQFMQALTFNGVETRMVIFHGENHELSRSGKPVHRIKRLTEITEWFLKHTQK